jgi:hypothetical protein
VNASSEGGRASCDAMTEENDYSKQSDSTTKAKGMNSNLYSHAIIDRELYKAIDAEGAVAVHNNYYHTFAKIPLNYIVIVIDSAMVFKVYATFATATSSGFD